MYKKTHTNQFKTPGGVSSLCIGPGNLYSMVCGSGSCLGGGGGGYGNYHNSLQSTINTATSNTLGLCYYNFFTLPSVDMRFDKDGKCIPLELMYHSRQEDEPASKPYISSSIYSHLCNMKQQIEQYQSDWDNIKKFTNPFEFIHTNIAGNKTNISKLRPLSRSFYKMIEIVIGTNLLNEYSNTIKTEVDYHAGINTFHLAEGPGGFIEAISYLRGLEYDKIKKNKQQSLSSSVSTTQVPLLSTNVQILKRNTDLHDEYMKELEHNKISKRIFDRASSCATVSGNTQDLTTGHISASMHKYNHQYEIYGNDRYYGMTLINDDPICPGWKKTKTFLDANPNVIIETGEDKTGNLLSISNFNYCASKYKNKMELITADGGFDFSLDFNNQENIAIRLILAEVFFALAMQKKGGSFVLKIFDIFHKPTVDILYLLSYYYSNVSIIKPYTSRIANSEKYVICQNFKLDDSTLVIEEISRVFPYIIDGNSEIMSLLARKHDVYYLNKIEEMNAILSFQQIDNISSTLSIITTHKNAEKIEQYKKLNIQKCISWCEKYNIPYFKQTASVSGGNIFLHRP
jgi:23S rRNA U2552 (ribose-2'-O)-methylase RlmE/FtsJ